MGLHCLVFNILFRPIKEEQIHKRHSNHKMKNIAPSVPHPAEGQDYLCRVGRAQAACTSVLTRRDRHSCGHSLLGQIQNRLTCMFLDTSSVKTCKPQTESSQQHSRTKSLPAVRQRRLTRNHCDAPCSVAQKVENICKVKRTRSLSDIPAKCCRVT